MFNKTKLKVLDLEVLSIFKEYHDDGFVQSIQEYVKELDKKYLSRKRDYSEYKNWIGICYKQNFPSWKHVHIAYVGSKSNPYTVFIRAHEETHALEHLGIGGLYRLSEKILETQNVKINFKKIDEEEIRADIGGIYVLQREGYSLESINLIFNNEHTEKAINLYKQSKTPEKIITF